ncbi:MAG: hypothetical protein LQ338_006620 [Usnochroma carphineum]|nr:MAG: hypothetical protein LQ338_006620 [Usnochroma carphineum]
MQSATSAQDPTWNTNPKSELRSCLAAVKYVGKFMSYRTSQINADPGIYINDIGSISLPLRTDDAAQILKAANQAPFGRGSNTVIDTSFRNTKQLDPASFQLRNPAWTGFLQDIIKHLGVGLGYPDSPSGIKAELHKLLLYDEGSMFKPHKDSEKAEGMFATLVICLPSKHDGGEIILTHHGEEEIVKTSEESEFGQTHIAWYSDVLHEIKPVTTGYRFVLTYNLIRTQAGIPTSAETILQERQALSRTLQEWKRRYDTRQPMEDKLVYILDHDYSTANLRFDNLKGRDRLVGRYVKDACDSEGFTMLFANLDLEYTKNEDDEEPEVLGEEWKLSHVVYPNGRLVLDSADLRDEELVQLNPYDRFADRTEDEETGNEGVNTTYFYHDTGLMDQVKSHSSQSAREELIRICKRESKARAQLLGSQCVKACQELEDPDLLYEIAEGCAQYDQYQDVYKAFADCVEVFGFEKLQPCFDKLISAKCRLHQDLNKVATFRRYPDKQPLKERTGYVAWEKSTIQRLLESSKSAEYEYGHPLLKVVKWYGESFSVESVLPYLIRNTSETTALIAFVAGLSVAVRDEKVAVSTADPFFNQLIKPLISSLSLELLQPSQDCPKEPSWWTTWKDTSNGARKYEAHLGQQISRLFCLCRTRGLDVEAGSLLTWLDHEAGTAHIAVFPFVLVPFLKVFRSMLEKTGLTVSPEIQDTCVSITTKLNNRCIGLEPQKPVDWSRAPVKCKAKKDACEICARVNAFLEDPVRTEETVSSNEANHLPYTMPGAGWRYVSLPGGGKLVKDIAEWTSQHYAWASRLGEVQRSMPPFHLVKDLYGDKWHEIKGMIWTRKAEVN